MVATEVLLFMHVTRLHSNGSCKISKTKIVEFANNIDPDEAAHDESHHLGLLHCPSTL